MTKFESRYNNFSLITSTDCINHFSNGRQPHENSTASILSQHDEQIFANRNANNDPACIENRFGPPVYNSNHFIFVSSPSGSSLNSQTPSSRTKTVRQTAENDGAAYEISHYRVKNMAPTT